MRNLFLILISPLLCFSLPSSTIVTKDFENYFKLLPEPQQTRTSFRKAFLA